ncbi:MAG: FAD-binding protein [Bacteroidales bacterium]|nr:FAD-binding protein [Bacteroidales bacterium]
MNDRQNLHFKLTVFQQQFEGEILIDDTSRILYATDASAYREIPLGVARPKNDTDIKKLICLAQSEKFSLIPRTAGTSLAGQVVGGGLVVDVSRHMTDILEINPREHWARVQPGVILDELNKEVEKHGLFFGPETSTSSRCMMGGMVGNNSCGAHSILYGSTRVHVISVKGFLSDGSEVEFKELTLPEFSQKCQGEKLENKIYQQIREILTNPENRQTIRQEYPDPSIHRRNTGYALDLLLDTEPFADAMVLDKTDPFNFCKLIAGSEGTLMFITEIRLNLVPLPPKEKALICVHCNSVGDALRANLVALKYKPGSVELMDKAIMDCTRDNITQRQNRFFIQGDPGAILIIEFARETKEEILQIYKELEAEMRERDLGYHFPIVFPPDLKKVWDLRKAGLGVLSNYPGDRKPVPVTEDTAVNPEVLPDYINEFDKILERLGLACVYYAHVGSGELHLRPVLNLKDPVDVELFHTIAQETAKLVKKYKGSLSGEHGDGRLRGEFIPLMLGDHNYQLLKEIKALWDPNRVFNPNKITDTPRMNTQLRFEPGKPVREIPTHFDFSDSHGILRAAEQCNGSGDCRNTIITGRRMCPSYMAMKDENTTTRARANILREFLTHSTRKNPFDHPEIYMVMDLCLSCKACKSECPSNVDIAKLKAEFLQHYYDSHGVPIRSNLIAHITAINRLGSIVPSIFNFFLKNRILSGIIKQTLGFAKERNIPALYHSTFRKWLAHEPGSQENIKVPSVYLFIDEFTDYNDVPIGIKAVQLLKALGYAVLTTDHEESGRTFISKGLIRKAKKLANRNVKKFKDLVTEETPLIGIEPSAILSFRDEYPDLVGPSLRNDALELAKHTFLFDEFILQVMATGDRNPANLFTSEKKHIKLHGHCHQKALGSVATTRKMLSLPLNYTVEEINSGCCGMAGAFGYEREHYEVSMKVGELVLFPEIRKAGQDVIIAAPGTSCRHQIMDGTGRTAFHPIEILFDALRR